MKRSRHQAIRDLLLAAEDGLTINQIAEHFGAGPKTIQKTIKGVWGVYIDRWTVPKRGQYSAIFMCTEPLPDAPHPTERYLPQTQWQSVEARS